MSGPHKKGGHEEGGGHAPMWIVSFADMVILLMSFFVLLLCQGQQKTTADAEMLKVLASVKANFGYRPKPNSQDPLDIAVMQVLALQQKGGFVHSGQRWKSASLKGTAIKERDNWLKAQSPIGRPFYFQKNSTKLAEDATTNLGEIAAAIRNHYRSIILQAHCSEEEALKDPLGGDDLAFRRALVIKNLLVEHGVSATRLRPVICSSHESKRALTATNRQTVIVTLGSYFLPNDHDQVDQGALPEADEAKPAKSSGHGGH